MTFTRMTTYNILVNVIDPNNIWLNVIDPNNIWLNVIDPILH